MTELSVVVIGRNEAAHLPSLFQSLSALNANKEIIYVDSASTDASTKIAIRYADYVFALTSAQPLSAAAGRYVGTLNSHGEWILYLDGDMELEADFAEFLNSRSFALGDPTIAGYVGYYTYIYNNGTRRANAALQVADKPANRFGGAVLLRKESVIAAGNWNPAVIANEEIDLYCRMRKQGDIVWCLNRSMVKHYAVKISSLRILAKLMLPLDRSYCGFGQALRSQIEHGSLSVFVRKEGQPFLMALLVMLPLLDGFNLLLFLPLAAYAIFVSATKAPRYVVLYLSHIMHAAAGFFTYRPFVPSYTVVKEVKEKSNQ